MKRIYTGLIGLTLIFTSCAENNKDIKSDILGLDWYSEKDTVKQEMNDYIFKNESEEIGASGEKQTLLEYSGVTLHEKQCDVRLCFTSMGLIGINYNDISGQYEQWVEYITMNYGEPTETSDFNMASWENDPIGTGTSIYVFEIENGVQISFFADETGSETVQQ